MGVTAHTCCTGPALPLRRCRHSIVSPYPVLLVTQKEKERSLALRVRLMRWLTAKEVPDNKLAFTGWLIFFLPRDVNEVVQTGAFWVRPQI